MISDRSGPLLHCPRREEAEDLTAEVLVAASEEAALLTTLDGQ
jgi:hypothetical protein